MDNRFLLYINIYLTSVIIPNLIQLSIVMIGKPTDCVHQVQLKESVVSYFINSSI